MSLRITVMSQISASVLIGLKNMMLQFKVVLFCAERKLKWCTAYQECPAEARRALHLHSTDTHWQRRSLCPPGCQRWVVASCENMTLQYFWFDSLFCMYVFCMIFVAAYPWLVLDIHTHLGILWRDNTSAVYSSVTVGRKKKILPQKSA